MLINCCYVNINTLFNYDTKPLQAVPLMLATTTVFSSLMNRM